MMNYPTQIRLQPNLLIFIILGLTLLYFLIRDTYKYIKERWGEQK